MADLLASIGAIDAISIKNLASRKLLSGHGTLLGDIVDQEVQSVAASIATSRATKPQIALPQALDIDQRNALTTAFPAYNLQFDNVSVNNHGVAAAITKLSYRLHFDAIGYDRNTANTDKGTDPDKRRYDDYVCIIGGDPAKQVAERNVSVHCCNPILSTKDSARVTERNDRITRMVTRLSTKRDVESVERVKLAQHYFSSTAVTCNLKAQDCPRTARYTVAVHSTYDIPLPQLGDIMLQKRCLILRANMMFSPAILYTSSGLIPGVDAHYRKEGKSIIFSFERDNSLDYRHDYNTYISYFTTNHFYSTDMKHLFQIEMLENRLGVQYFKVVMITHKVPKIDAMSHSVWFGELRGMSVLTVMSPNLSYVAQGRSKWWWRWGIFNKYRRATIGNSPSDVADTYDGVFEVKYVLVETQTVDRLRSFAYASTEAKFKDKELFAYLKSVMSEVFFGSEVVKRRNPLSHEVMVNLALAVYVDIYAQKYDMGKVMQQLIMDINSDRSLSTKSLLGKLFHSRPSAYDSEVWPLLGVGYLHQFMWWLKSSPAQYKKLITPADEFARYTSKPNSMVSMMELKLHRAYDHVKNQAQELVSSCSILRFENETPRNFSYCPVAVAVMGAEYCELIANNLKKNFQIDTSADEVRDVLNLRLEMRTSSNVLLSDQPHAQTNLARLNRARRWYHGSENRDAMHEKANHAYATDAVQYDRWRAATAHIKTANFGLYLRFQSDAALRALPTGDRKPIIVSLAGGPLSDYSGEVTLDAVRGLVVRSYDRAELYSTVCCDYDVRHPSDSRDPIAVLLAIENLVALGGDAVCCLPLNDVLTPKVFDIVVRTVRYFSEFTIYRDSKWYMASEEIYLQFTNRNVAVGDHRNIAYPDDASTRLRVGASLRACVECLITDLYRLVDEHHIPSAPKIEHHPYVRVEMGKPNDDTPDTPPPSYDEYTEKQVVEYCAKIRSMSSNATDEYVDCKYRQQLKLYSLLRELPLLVYTEVMELGAAPGTWSMLLYKKFSNSNVPLHLVSSVGGLRYSKECDDLRGSPNVFHHDSDAVAYLSTSSRPEGPILVVCDVANANSWIDDFLQTRIATLLTKLVSSDSHLILKLPNVYTPNVQVVTLELGKLYNVVKLVKPKGSRLRSTEVYCVCYNAQEPATTDLGELRSKFTENLSTIVKSTRVEKATYPPYSELESFFLTPVLPEQPTPLPIPPKLPPVIASDEHLKSKPIENPPIAQEAPGPALPIPAPAPLVPIPEEQQQDLLQTQPPPPKSDLVEEFTFRELDASNYVVVPIPGDGQCCYNALSQGNCKNLTTLKEDLLRTAKSTMSSEQYKRYSLKVHEGAWGDVDDLQMYAATYGVSVVVYDYSHRVVHRFGEGLPVRVRYDNSHYDSVIYCPFETVGPRTHNLPPAAFPTQQFKVWFNSTLLHDKAASVTKNYYTAKLLGFVMGMFNSGYNYLDEASPHVLVVERECDIHAKCNFDAVMNRYLEIPTAEYATLVMYLDQNYMDLLAEFVRRYEVTTESIFHPMLYKKGYIAFKMIRDPEKRIPVVDPRVSANYQFNHMGQCTSCGSTNAWDVTTLYYQPITCMYSTCRHSHAVVIPTNSRPKDVRVYTLRPTDVCAHDVDMDGDIVYIAVRYVNASRLDQKTMAQKLPSLVSYLRAHQPFVEKLCIDVCATANSEDIVNALKPYCASLYVVSRELVTEKIDTKFAPECVIAINVTNKRKNAMFECAEMLRYEQYRVARETAKYAEQHRCYISAKNRSDLPRVVMAAGKIAIINFFTGQFLLGNVDFDIRTGFARGYCYASRTMVDLSMSFDSNGKPRIIPELGHVAVTKDCKLYNSDQMYAAVTKHRQRMDDIGELDVTYVDGAPGVGKTRFILQHHDTSNRGTECVVLSVSRQSAESFKHKVSEMYHMDERVAKLRYRTLDSFIINHTDDQYPHVTEMWIDEGVMEHAGKLLWAAAISRTKKLYVVGDQAQIPFIDRDSDRALRYHTVEHLIPNLSKRTTDDPYYTSHRVPQDVAAYLGFHKMYPIPVKTSSSVVASLELYTERGFYNFKTKQWSGRPNPPLTTLDKHIGTNVTVLVYKQDDKVYLKATLAAKNVNVPIFTIHEFQGSEARKIVLVRISPKPNPIYGQLSHNVVAITRHTHKFVYITPDGSDLMTRNLTNGWYDLGVIQNTHVMTLSGGGILAGANQNKQFPEYSVDYVYEKTYDVLKQNKVLRELVHANRGNNIIPMRPVVRKLEVTTPSELVVPTQPIENPMVVLQEFVDTMIPGGSTRIMRYDTRRVEEQETHVTSSCSVRDMYRSMGANKPDTLTSSLRTSCPPMVNDTLRQYLKAYGERNGGVPDYGGVRDDWELSSQMLDKFCQAYLVHPRALDIYADSEIDINVDSIEDWLSGKPESVFRLIETDEDYSIYEKDLSVYNMMLKRLPKIVTDAEAAFKNKSPQTILYQCQKVNAIFSPIVREMKARLVAALRKDKIIATDMSIDEMEELMSYRFPPSRVSSYRATLEGDIGKFDKSQELLALYFELKMMLKLGFPQKYVSLWVYMHVYTRMLARTVGFSAFVHFQRKSGDAMTFLGNTMFLMAVVVCVYGVEVVRRAIGWFAGDDYYLITKSIIDLTDAVRKFAMGFNLELKMMTKRTPYFCSKFFVPTAANRWKIIPDLVKTAVKLGRRDLVNATHVSEFRQSLKDLYRDFNNMSYVPYLDVCLADRYKPFGAEIVFRAIYTIIFDDQQWEKLYYVADNDTIDDKRGFSHKDF